jgi:hypothetical protein
LPLDLIPGDPFGITQDLFSILSVRAIERFFFEFLQKRQIIGGNYGYLDPVNLYKNSLPAVRDSFQDISKTVLTVSLNINLARHCHGSPATNLMLRLFTLANETSSGERVEKPVTTGVTLRSLPELRSYFAVRWASRSFLMRRYSSLEGSCTSSSRLPSGSSKMTALIGA